MLRQNSVRLTTAGCRPVNCTSIEASVYGLQQVGQSSRCSAGRHHGANGECEGSQRPRSVGPASRAPTRARLSDASGSHARCATRRREDQQRGAARQSRRRSRVEVLVPREGALDKHIKCRAQQCRPVEAYRAAAQHPCRRYAKRDMPNCARCKAELHAAAARARLRGPLARGRGGRGVLLAAGCEPPASRSPSSGARATDMLRPLHVSLLPSACCRLHVPASRRRRNLLWRWLASPSSRPRPREALLASRWRTEDSQQLRQGSSAEESRCRRRRITAAMACMQVAAGRGCGERSARQREAHARLGPARARCVA
jgi:hypothetical protein